MTDIRPPAGARRPVGRSAHQLVPKHLVHKSAGAGVLLEQAVPAGEDRFTVTTRWPASGRLFHAGDQGEPVLMAEAMRQSAIYLSHDRYGVPLDHLFLLSGVDVDITGAGIVSERQDSTAPLAVSVDVRARTSRRFSAALQADVIPAPGVLAGGTLQWDALHPLAYQRIRGTTPSQHVRVPGPGRQVGHRLLAAEAVGCQWQADVLLADNSSGFRLVLDPGHPGYFDHVVDHVPGMVFLEAFRQASYHTVRHGFDARAPQLVRLSAQFNSFAEFEAPVEIRSTVRTARHGLASLDLVALQEGKPVASMLGVWQFEGGVPVPEQHSRSAEATESCRRRDVDVPQDSPAAERVQVTAS